MKTLTAEQIVERWRILSHLSRDLDENHRLFLREPVGLTLIGRQAHTYKVGRLLCFLWYLALC